MAIEVVTKDCTQLSDAELAEMADICVDGPSRLCLGCYRTLPEIVRWQRLTDEERAAIMAELPSRRKRIDPKKLR